MKRAGMILAPLGLLGMAAAVALGHERAAFMPLRWSSADLTSLLWHHGLGAALALHIAGLSAWTRHRKWTLPEWMRARIGQAAACTFSIYLYHVPLMWLTRAALGPRIWLLITLPLLGSVALAQVTERRKNWPLQALDAIGQWHSRTRRAV